MKKGSRFVLKAIGYILLGGSLGVGLAAVNFGSVLSLVVGGVIGVGLAIVILLEDEE